MSVCILRKRVKLLRKIELCMCARFILLFYSLHIYCNISMHTEITTAELQNEWLKEKRQKNQQQIRKRAVNVCMCIYSTNELCVSHSLLLLTENILKWIDPFIRSLRLMRSSSNKVPLLRCHYTSNYSSSGSIFLLLLLSLQFT